MKRDTVMAMLMANHVIDMVKKKRVEEDALIKGLKPEAGKEHPLQERVQQFFNNNPNAFGCERSNAVKLMAAVTGFDYVNQADNNSKYYDQYSVIASVISWDRDSLTVKPGTILLVGSATGIVFNPLNQHCTKCKIWFNRLNPDARRATDEEYASFMKVMETDEAKQNLATWIANNGIADCFFGLKLEG